MALHPSRGSLLQEITRVNPWWTNPEWESADPQIRTIKQAPYERRPAVLDDIQAPNLYSLRGPRRVGKSTVLKQTIARLIQAGIDRRRVCYFAADSIENYRDLINVLQVARQLFPDLGGVPRYFLIDEVTSIRDWQRGVKWLRDNTAVSDDCVVVTGSSVGDIATGTYDLAGRRGPLVGLDRLLLPMSFPEFVRCAGYSLPDTSRLSLSEFYDEAGRQACQDALVHSGLLIDAFEAYLVVGGFPQAVSGMRRFAEVPSGLVRDMWDVVQSDLSRQGISRPEQCLNLLARVAESVTAPTSMRTLADRLSIDQRTAGAWIDALANAYLVLILFKDNDGVPDVASLRKIYPIDPLIARLPSNYSEGVYEPNLSQLAEAAIGMAIFRSVEGGSVDHFHQPSRLFYYRSSSNTEIDFLALPARKVVESKYIDTADRRELRAMQANFGDGLLLTRAAVDIQASGMILPAALFCWLLEQP